MRALLIVSCLLFVVRSDADQVLTFPEALDRALRTRGASATYERQASILESLPARTMPVVRAESGFSNLVTERVDHFNGLTTLVSVDYPLFDQVAAQRRAEALRFDAKRLRQRAIEEEDEVFQQTLDAFGDLAATEQRMELLRAGVSRAAKLRERTRAMLEVGQISNVTAAQWQDQALAAESMLIDLELQRLNAETRLKQLMGDTTPTRLHADWSATARTERSRSVPAAGPAAPAPQAPSFQYLLTAYGGVADYEGTFGIYGLRFTVTFDPSASRRAAAERIAFENNERARALAERAEQNRLELLQLELSAAERRVELLAQSIDVARKREESVARLASAGVRTEADVVATTSEIARRESDLAGARIEAWKLQQRIERSAAR